MITIKELLMGREKEYPLSAEVSDNLMKLLKAVSIVRDAYAKPMTVTSGYRPGHYNKAAHGAANSAHLTCEAVDFADVDGKLGAWCESNLAVLAKAGLYMENKAQTPTWVHLQTRKPASGNRIFNK